MFVYLVTCIIDLDWFLFAFLVYTRFLCVHFSRYLFACLCTLYISLYYENVFVLEFVSNKRILSTRFRVLHFVRFDNLINSKTFVFVFSKILFSYSSVFFLIFVMTANNVRVKFMIRAEPSPSESRTTVTHIKWMQPLDDEDQERFAFPEKFQALTHHETLFTNTTAAAAKRDMTPRWTTRMFKVSLAPDVAALYVDDNGNAMFRGSMLNVFDEKDLIFPPPLTSSPLAAPSTDPPPTRSLSSIVKDAVITKFNPKFNVNPEAWLQIFESECTRLNVGQDRFWETIRLFLEEGAEKWYTTTRLSCDSTSWEFWKTSFVDNFGVRGLAAARSAYSYRYINGSLSDYCQNKLSLLVSFNPKMHEIDKIAQVSLGLPLYLQDRINLNECNTLGRLLGRINSFDKPSVRTISLPSHTTSSSGAFSSLKPFCNYCKKKGFERRHVEKDCFIKQRDQQRNKSNVKYDSPPKAIHNVEIDELVNEVLNVQKNE